MDQQVRKVLPFETFFSINQTNFSSPLNINFCRKIFSESSSILYARKNLSDLYKQDLFDFALLKLGRVVLHPNTPGGREYLEIFLICINQTIFWYPRARKKSPEGSDSFFYKPYKFCSQRQNKKNRKIPDFPRKTACRKKTGSYCLGEYILGMDILKNMSALYK